MKVYILEVGEYEQRGVNGVFTTPEAAMAAYPVDGWAEHEPQEGYRRSWYTDDGDRARVEEWDVCSPHRRDPGDAERQHVSHQ